jgi:hypothetical protein
MAQGRSYSTLERTMRRHTWWRFREIAALAAHHLRLSVWETDFILTLAELGEQTGGEAELSDKQLKVLLHLEDRVMVQQLLDQARGDPRLSAWEEGFLTNLANSPARLSEKQVRVFLRIQTMFTAPAESEADPLAAPTGNSPQDQLPEATEAVSVPVR